MSNSEKLIQHLLTVGKQNYSWFDLAVLYEIRPDGNKEQRKKAANDIWRAYNRGQADPVSPNTGLSIRRKKTWQTYDGSVRESIEYNMPVETAIQKLVDLKEEFIKSAKEHSPRYPKVAYKAMENRDTILEISIPDLHLGQLAWGQESGEDFDIDIAKNRFLAAVEYFKNGCGIAPSKYLFIIGNDIFNSDNLLFQTTAGTQQQDDTRWQKSFIEGRKMIVKAVDSLREKAPVDIVVIPGNHDLQRSFYLGDSIECWYNNCPDVNVDNTPKTRKYYRYGVNLLGYTHGKEEKLASLPMLMATEAPKDWAETKHREWHLGHLHKTFMDENFGVVTRILPSLTSTDSWHKSKGFVGNMKAAQAYLWHKDAGYLSHHQYNI